MLNHTQQPHSINGLNQSFLRIGACGMHNLAVTAGQGHVVIKPNGGCRHAGRCVQSGAMKLKDADWTRLADFARAARLALGLTQAELAAKAGIGFTTIQLLERGTARTRLPDTIPAVEAALGWAPGSARAVLGGGVPEPVASLPAIRVELMSEDADRVAAAIASAPNLSASDRARLLREIFGRLD